MNGKDVCQSVPPRYLYPAIRTWTCPCYRNGEARFTGNQVAGYRIDLTRHHVRGIQVLYYIEQTPDVHSWSFQNLSGVKRPATIQGPALKLTAIYSSLGVYITMIYYLPGLYSRPAPIQSRRPFKAIRYIELINFSTVKQRWWSEGTARFQVSFSLVRPMCGLPTSAITSRTFHNGGKKQNYSATGNQPIRLRITTY